MWLIIIFFLYTDSLKTYHLKETVVKDSLIKKETHFYPEFQTFLPVNIFSSNGLGSIDINGNGSVRSLISFNGVILNSPQNNFYSLTSIPPLLINYFKMENASITTEGKGILYIKSAKNRPSFDFSFIGGYRKDMQFSFNMYKTDIKWGIIDCDNHFNENSRIKSPNNYLHQIYFFLSNKYTPIFYVSSSYKGIPSNSFEILRESKVISKEVIGSIKKGNLCITLHYTKEHYTKNEGMYYYNDVHTNYVFNINHILSYKSVSIKPYIEYQRINSTKIGIKDRILWGSSFNTTYRYFSFILKFPFNKTNIIIPSLSVNYSRKYIKISAGTFTHMPSFNDLYWPVSTFAAGNPFLKEEKGIYFDTKIKKSIFNIEMYLSMIYDGIVWQNNGELWEPYNEDMFFSFSTIFEIKKGNFNFYINPRITRTVNYWIPYKPIYLSGLSYTKQTEYFFWGINVFSKGPYYTNASNIDKIEGYTIISPFIGIKHKNFYIKYEIYNLTNTIYEEPFGYEGEGRTFNIEIKIGG